MPPSARPLAVLLGLVAAPGVATTALLLYSHEDGAGSHWTPPAAAGVSAAGRTFLALAVILVLGRLAGRALHRLGQPLVIGEMLAGIVLGPAVLGLVAPGAFHWLFAPDVVGALGALAQLGLALFMFLVGLELNLPAQQLRRAAVYTPALAAVAVPLCDGTVAALAAHRDLGQTGGDPAISAMFVGVCMSVTAFPVLARILMERGIFHTPLGGVAMVSAAVTDVLAWLLLAVVVAAARDGSPMSIVRTASLLGTFAVAMQVIARPLLARVLARRADAPADRTLTLVLIGVLVSAAITEALGVHLIFGAFLFGLCCPREAPALEVARNKIADLTSSLFMPPFFALVGIRTQVTQFGDRPEAWAWFVVFLGLAVLGKAGAAALAAWGVGLPVSASRLGVLLSCKGLTELVMLGVGLDLKVLGGELFTVLVLVTVVTTAMTVPLLDLVDRVDRRRAHRLR